MILVNKGKSYIPKTFEQYEYKGWLITIEDSQVENEFFACAVLLKYSYLLNIDSAYWVDEILDENDIVLNENEIVYFYHNPFDEIYMSVSDLLEWLVLEILEIQNIKKRPDTVVLKQIQRKSIAPKTSKRKSGFLNQAWAAMVKERDQKCMECKSIYDLHSHHIKSYKDNPELRTDVNNGITLCGSCHRNWHKINGR